MAKVIILNYAASCVETLILPEGIESSEQIEQYLSDAYDYHMSEINYMVVDNGFDNLVPVFVAGEHSTNVFI